MTKTDKTTAHVALETPLLKRIDKLAKLQGRSRNNMIWILLHGAVTQEEHVQLTREDSTELVSK